MCVPVLIVYLKGTKARRFFSDITGDPPRLATYYDDDVPIEEHYLRASSLKEVFVVIIMRWNEAKQTFAYEEISGPPINGDGYVEVGCFWHDYYA